ncbi:MAG: hypothetical protein DRG35_00980 [Deltaproteobacteria bacterium]|nr:MAG: hypothetical protein DRG35_00980 [Deltaproteobacteria bacterium]RLB25707.1 MAG: hypothetical protein DRG73_01060 [Deltaproteobacteria bacterium]
MGNTKKILINEFRTMKYTCIDYRSEMKLLGLKRRLEEENLSEEEKALILQEIEELEKAMKMN